MKQKSKNASHRIGENIYKLSDKGSIKYSYNSMAKLTKKTNNLIQNGQNT
jgi:hypothetical protein